MAIRVVKVGGSLLDWPPLASALRAWLADQPPAANVLVCGGGPLCDVIRQAARIHWLGEEPAHWLCVDLLSASARLLAAILRDVPVVDVVDRQDSRPAVILDPRRFLMDVEPHLPGCVLPRNWAATSDSIAARIAETLAAEELVLLKSAEPALASWQELAAASFVDSFFPHIAAGLNSARVVNLRNSARAHASAERLG
jgi:aspartokinase-like uncharacterized kinase